MRRAGKVPQNSDYTLAMVDRIAEEIQTANEFGDKIEDLVLARKQAPTGDRNTLLMAYWSLAFEFHRAILSLIEQKFYGAAFALVRPIIEATVRAHVTLMCSDEVLQRLHNDEYRTKSLSPEDFSRRRSNHFSVPFSPTWLPPLSSLSPTLG